MLVLRASACQTGAGEHAATEVTDRMARRNVLRLEINLGSPTYYDSGQMLKNLLFRNPGFAAPPEPPPRAPATAPHRVGPPVFRMGPHTSFSGVTPRGQAPAAAAPLPPNCATSPQTPPANRCFAYPPWETPRARLPRFSTAPPATPSSASKAAIVSPRSTGSFPPSAPAYWSLAPYSFKRGDGKTVKLYGSAVDFGVTDRKRPQYLALELASHAILENLTETQGIGRRNLPRPERAPRPGHHRAPARPHHRLKQRRRHHQHPDRTQSPPSEDHQLPPYSMTVLTWVVQ